MVRPAIAPFWGVVRRQLPVATALGVLAAALILVVSLFQRDLYSSSVTASYDQRDALGLPTLASSSARFAQVSAMLKARLGDPEFLWQLAETVELSLAGPEGGQVVDDSSSKAKVAALLAPAFRATANRQGQTLTIKVGAEDPLTAKRLADAAMELFIQEELRFEAETFHRLYEAHAKYLAEVKAVALDDRLVGPPGGEGNDPEFRRRLEERVQELDLERRRLTAQIDSPADRTRLRVTLVATYDDQPTSRPGRRWGWLLGCLSVLGIVGVGAAREQSSPWVTTGSRVKAVTGLPVLAEVPRAVLKVLPALNPAKAAALKDAARHGDSGDPMVTVWLTFQDIELALRRVAVGPVVLLVGEGRTSGFVHNWLTLLASSGDGVRLVIDGDESDPLLSGEERRLIGGDLLQFLSGQRPWKSVRQSRSKARAYDLVVAPVSDGKTPPPKQELLARLFTSLCRGYSQVFVRAHGSRNVTENAAYAATATDVILVVEARRSRLAMLTAAADLFGRAKVRGVILIDT